jgi:multicomponent Na+:H+ antiporter subunit C
MMLVTYYTIAGLLLFCVGLGGLFFCRDLMRKVMAVNLAGSGVFLVLVDLAQRQGDVPPDPIPHAMVLTGIVIAVSATAVALALHRRLAPSAAEGTTREGPG